MAHLCCCPLLFNFGIQPDTKENVCPDIFNNLERSKAFGNNVWLPEKFQEIFRCERLSKYERYRVI